MKALVWTEKEKVELQNRPLPDTAGKILIQVAYAGICGSDISVYLGKHPRAKAPLIMGHEFVGVVEAIGEGVETDLKKGDKVVVDPLIYCGKCNACLNGNTHVCRALNLYGTDCDGGMAEYVAVADHTVLKLPEDMDLKTAALIEPVAVIVHGLRMIKKNFYTSACITGLGPMGLLAAIMLKNSGVNRLFTVETNKKRAEHARRLGFEVIDPKTEDVVSYIKKRTGGEGVEVFVEASGAPMSAAVMTDITSVRGEILLLSVFKEPAAVDLRAVNFKEQILVGCRVYTQLDFKDAISYTYNHADEISAIISHLHPIEDGQRVFQDMIRGSTEAMKVLFALQQ